MTWRALNLYFLSLKSFGHRIRHNWASELVVLVCAGVLVGLFLYVFDDFINHEVKSISLGMREVFAQALSGAIVMVASVVAGSLIAEENDLQGSFAPAATYLGEWPATIRAFRWLRILTLVLVSYGLAWVVVFRFFVVWSWVANLRMLGLAGAMTLFLARRSRLDSGPTQEVKPETKVDVNRSRPMVMLRWRLARLLSPTGPKLVAGGGAGLFVLIVGALAWRGAPAFALVAASYCAGFLLAVPLALLTADDLEHAWIDRAAGVSHREFIGTYQRLGWLLGLSASGLVTLAGFTGFLFAQTSVGGTGTANSFFLFQCATVAVVPAAIMPALLLQIDGKRPAIPVLTGLIAGLFVGTAVYAHFLALALVPLIISYGGQTQAGRFYRA